MADYRRFEKLDWDAFAGAEPFSNAEQPFIYNRNLNSGLVELTIIADKNGIELHLYSDGEDDVNVWFKDIPNNLTSIRAEGELRQLIKVVEEYTYAPDLAYELDHPTHEVTKGFNFN